MRDSELDIEWLASRNRAWFADKGQHAVYFFNHLDGRIYFYKNAGDYPDNPDAWCTEESIGTWAPRSKSFMWTCDNKTAVGKSFDISKKGKQWFEDNRNFTGRIITNVASLDMAWAIIAVASRLSNVIAVYNAPCKYRDVKEEGAVVGTRVTIFNRNKIINNEFVAITGPKNIVSRE